LQQRRNENKTNRQVVRPTTSTQSLIDKFISLDSKPKNTENIGLKTAELTHKINDFLPQHNDSKNINNFNSNIEDNIDKVIESLTNEENINIFLARQRLKFMENKVINQDKNNTLYLELRIAAHNIDGIASIQSFPKLNNLLEFIEEHKIDIIAISEINIDYRQGHFINQKIKSKVYSIIFSERNQKGKGSGTALVIHNKWMKHYYSLIRISPYIIIAKFLFIRKEIWVWSIYAAPNDQDIKNKLISELEAAIGGQERVINNTIILHVILGDFNDTFDNKIDRSPSTSQPCFPFLQ
jgi:hypothetical protein